MDINAVIDERFAKWSIHFRREHATPVMTVGINARKRELVFTTLVGINQGEMRDMLVEAIRLIDAGMITDDPKPEATRGLDT